MRHLWTIFRRELGAYFNSSIAAIFLIVFALFSNGLFMMQFFQAGKADMRAFFGSLPFILNLFIPAIAMRLWAEDKRGNTFELLLTFPMRSYELVLGKYLASAAFYLVALATTWTIPVMISWAGHPDGGVILGGYLGALLLGALFLAVGIFLSGLCKDQITAFILTAVATFTVFFLGTDFFAAAIDGWAPGLGSFLKDNLGAASHLVGFGRGIVDTGDALYFLFGIAAFLFLNGLSLEGRFRPKAKLVFSASVAVCAASLVLLNWLTRDLPLGRFDLTEGRVNTVSAVSKKILTGLKDPAKVTLYISAAESMPTALKTLEREIMDKLDELKAVSGGRLETHVTHPDLSALDEAFKAQLVERGVAPFQVESVQQDEIGVKLIFSTLVIEYKDKPREVLPRLVPQALGDLEYQIMSRVYKMSLEERPRVAVYAPMHAEAPSPEIQELLERSGQKNEQDFDDRFKTAVLLMRNNGYDVRRIALTKEDGIPDGAGTLLLLAPGALDERQRYEINRFLSQGGTVILAEQGYEYTFHSKETGVEAVPKKHDLSVNTLLEKWGVKINPDILFDESSQIISLSSGQTIGPFALQMPVKFPNQIVVLESMINRSASITKRIPPPMVLWGSALDLMPDTLKASGLRSTVLFTSSPRSWTMPYGGVPLNAENTRPPAKELTGKFPLAALLEGPFPMVASGEPVPDPKPGRLFLMGCSQAFNEDLLRNPGNLNLFANAVDGLVLGEDLVQIRSNAAIVRDLRPLTNAEKTAYRFFAVFLVPLILFAAALARQLIRKKEKEFYLSALRSAGSL